MEQLPKKASDSGGAEPNEQSAPAGQGTRLIELIEVIADRADPFMKILTTYAENSQNKHQSESVYRLRMAWVAVAVVVLIVGTAAVLTYVDKIDGSTFTFLLGLIVGYVLTFVRDAIEPSAE